MGNTEIKMVPIASGAIVGAAMGYFKAFGLKDAMSGAIVGAATTFIVPTVENLLVPDKDGKFGGKKADK